MIYFLIVTITIVITFFLLRKRNSATLDDDYDNLGPMYFDSDGFLASDDE